MRYQNKHNMTETAIKEITNATLSSITKTLKMYVPKWTIKMAAAFNEHPEWRKEMGESVCNVSTIRSVGAGAVISQFHRRLFIDCSHKLIEEYKAIQNRAADLAKKL